MKHFFITFIALFVFAIALSAQGRLFVRGYILDEKKNAITYASVQLKGEAIGSISNESGFYEIVFPRQDSVTLVFSCLGYETVERSFVPTIDQAYNILITMHSTSEVLGEVEVKAQNRQTSSMIALDADQLKFMPDASGGGIESLLTTFAGVSSNNELSSQYSVRGGSYDENSVYVNGIEVYRPLLVRAG
ncbi:MAG: carboxypeptidase-like regulatory domain-containing protein, partial [bacterium]